MQPYARPERDQHHCGSAQPGRPDRWRL